MAVWQEGPNCIQGHTYFQWLIAIIANLSLLTYGLQIGWVSPMAVILQSTSSPTGHALSATEMSWVGSVMALAAAFGVPLFSYLADAYGRKAAILLLPLPQAISWLLKLSSANTITIIIARIFCGVSAGGCFAVVPMYIKEISQDNIRGQLGSLLIMFQNVGVTIMYILGAYLGYFTTLYSVIWLPFLTFILLLKAPESPAFLIKIGKVNEAISAIAFLRGLDEDSELVIKEIDSMKNEDIHSKSQSNVSFISIFKNNVWRRSFFMVIALMTMHAGNGSFTIIVFASSILADSGSNVSPELQSLSFPLVSILGVLISIACIERFGRKIGLWVRANAVHPAPQMGTNAGSAGIFSFQNTRHWNAWEAIISITIDLNDEQITEFLLNDNSDSETEDNLEVDPYDSDDSAVDLQNIVINEFEPPNISISHLVDTCTASVVLKM